MRIVGDPARAEDLAVDAFSRLLAHPQAQGAGVEAWLYRTAVRLGIDELRRRSRRQRVERWLPFIRPPQTPDAIFSEAQERTRVAREIAANPAVVFHFPEHHRVREVQLRAGRGIVVGDEEGICFFWSTLDRLFIVSAPPMSDADLVSLADSFRTPHEREPS